MNALTNGAIDALISIFTAALLAVLGYLARGALEEIKGDIKEIRKDQEDSHKETIEWRELHLYRDHRRR